MDRIGNQELSMNQVLQDLTYTVNEIESCIFVAPLPTTAPMSTSSSGIAFSADSVSEYRNRISALNARLNEVLQKLNLLRP